MLRRACQRRGQDGDRDTAVGGLGGGLNTQIAWAYVALRIVHSLIQVTVNRVLWRFAVFALASLALLALCIHAFMGFVLH